MARRKLEPETAIIESASHDGRGIAAVAGKKVFVAGALKGEEVRFLRRKRRRNYDEAELLDVLKPSSSRIEPRCAVFGVCGGCSLQHVSDDDQRTIKQQSLRDNLQRIGHVAPQTWLSPVFNDSSEGSWHYRRRARLAVKDVPAKGRVMVGFREQHAPFVTNMSRCEVLAHPVDSLMGKLSTLVSQLSIRARLPQIEVAIADNATALIFRVLDPTTDHDNALLKAFGIEHSLRILLQTGGLDTTYSLHPEDDEAALHYRLDEFDVTIEFTGTDFVQINGPVNKDRKSVV